MKILVIWSKFCKTSYLLVIIKPATSMNDAEKIIVATEVVMLIMADVADVTDATDVVDVQSLERGQTNEGYQTYIYHRG